MPLHRKKVLIIDDEKRMANSLCELLRVSGYDAEAAYGGSEGMERLQREEYHVVVTDLRMPHTDGVDVMSYIANRCLRTLIIVITGHATTESAIEAVHYHVFDYLRKPFDFNLFRMAIEKAFQRLETDQLREDTAAMISHDIKIPLTSIIGFAAMLYEPALGQYHPRAPEFIETIQANGQKILCLIDNYLTTCKIESGTLKALHQTVKLERMIADAIEMAEPAASRVGQMIELEIKNELGEGWIDAVLAERALGNLIHNAIKYGGTEEPIRVSAWVCPAESSELGRPAVTIAVANHCNGPVPADFNEIFQRYERSESRPGVEGAGLGLYVVDAVARAHGGIARAAMLDEERVEFTIVIPLRNEPPSGTECGG